MKNVKVDEVKNVREVLNDYQIMKHLKSNNVIKERVELYRDFVINLIHYVHSTYLGKEYIKSEHDVKGHYDWAFKKVVAEFEEEGVIFGDTRVIHDYFYQYFLLHFYVLENTPSIRSFLGFWDNIFTFKANKEKTDLTALTDIYAMFDKGFNKKIIFAKML